MIYGTVMIAVLYGAGYSFESFIKGEVPSWFFNSAVLSPGDMHQTAVYRVFGQSVITFDFGGGLSRFEIPEFLNMGNLLIFHIIWFIIPLILAYFFFKRRDI
jgi:ABC-type transport system involved in multi-copper enzyme maturation permease subunit